MPPEVQPQTHIVLLEFGTVYLIQYSSLTVSTGWPRHYFSSLKFVYSKQFLAVAVYEHKRYLNVYCVSYRYPDFHFSLFHARTSKYDSFIQ